MRELFNSIQTYLYSQLPDITFIRIWNNNVDFLEQGKDEVSYSLPAIFVEFVSPINWKQLGNGVQTVDDLNIKLHLVVDELDAMDGQMSQNLNVLTFAQTVFSKFQDYYANVPAGVMTRIGDIQDDNHDNIYHFTATYITTWMDFTMMRPVGGTLSVPVLDYELDIINSIDTYLLLENGNILTQENGNYIILE